MVPFGRTGLSVSRLCFGTGSHGFPARQAALPVETLADLLVRGWEAGIRFWDTADRYGTYPHVSAALRRLPRQDVVVATKFHHPTRPEAEAALERALAELDTPYLDIVLMHEVDSLDEWEERQPALRVLHEAKADGRVRAVGLSTHSIDLLEFAAARPELDVLFTNLNHAHVHMDADIKHYLAALRRGAASGQGVYVHKTLGEGALANDVPRAIQHNLSLDCVHSVCVGLCSTEELDATLAAACVKLA
ncbi:MAG TPA: aldo/keto reductase [Candidatus Xenobia bacterium]|jgi:aryl-alcohol dehydrogenase-like predicted oxidoreductase